MGEASKYPVDELAWSKYDQDPMINKQRLIELLSRSAAGAKLLREAKSHAAQMGLTLEDVIVEGDVSITDTTLLRRFSASNPEHVAFETRSKIFLNRHLATREALLDFAHELTHFVHRTPFNPYVVNFSLKEFISTTVEGRGGEVDAFMMECVVLSELYPKYFRGDNHCRKILDRSGQVSRTQTISEFYRLGAYREEFVKQLNTIGLNAQLFPNISESHASFISSAYGLPYPLAAIKEYQQVLARACDNELKRMKYFEQVARSPASGSGAQSAYDRFTRSYKKRCH